MTHFQITDPSTGRYLGLVTMYDCMFSHSILSGGNNPFPFASKEDAVRDFWETKARLSAEVHRIIFGAAASNPPA